MPRLLAAGCAAAISLKPHLSDPDGIKANINPRRLFFSGRRRSQRGSLNTGESGQNAGKP